MANSYNLRIFLLLFSILVFFGLVAGRLFILQIVRHSYYEARASDQHGSETAIIPKRGEIFFGNRDPVLAATNVTKYLVYANQKQIADPLSQAAKLASILDMSKADLEIRLTGESVYAVIKKQLPDEASEKIKAMKIPGIYLEPEEIRFYPQGNLASQVLGFLGFKDGQRSGQYGIEEKYNKELAGLPGYEGTQTDASGRVIHFANRSFVPAIDGDDIYLTLDQQIQFKSQEVLNEAVSQHGASGGSVIVINPQTGDILAMASSPDFDLNNYGKTKNLASFTNAAALADYEPGSIFKPITMAAALNEGKLTPETTYEDSGSVELDDRIIKNSDAKAHGVQTMTQVLDASLNTGAVFALRQVGNDTFKKYVEKFGFGKPTDFGLPEVAGNLANLNKKGDVFFGTASFGQGITATPLQMIQAYTPITNGGKIIRPHIIRRIVHPDGSFDEVEKGEGEEVIDSKTAATLSAMLVSVVENGHGKRAAVKGYYIGGKTGTAQVPFRDRAGYDPNSNIGSFIGFGPVDNPKFLMIVRIDNPKDVRFAESTAAPAFGKIAEFILNYLQVPPSRQ